MSNLAPTAGWYADPSGQHSLRWWDGNAWTEHTEDGQQAQQSQGQQQTQAQQPQQQAQQPQQSQQQAQQPQQGQHQAYGQGQQQYGGQQGGYQQQGQPYYGQPQNVPPQQVSTQYTPDRVQRQVQQQAGVGPATGGSGHLLDEPILVVNQKTKLIEVTNEYAIFDQNGNQLGSVVEVGQSGLKKAVRVLTSWDQFLTHRLEVRDASGQALLMLTRPAKVFKSRVQVAYGNGQPIGEIVQENVFGKIRFGLTVGGQNIGSINAENWRAWNFSIQDGGGQEVARITKTWEGLARTMFTTADNYVVQLHQRLQDPLRAMVIASAVTVDTALKQDSRGLG
ncbi:MAG TPA: phospholipid scramblase-related protein [Frankiaceae bacterium]|nr:phospholipid scramblase-related protein [Frankiaceae bacterium]